MKRRRVLFIGGVVLLILVGVGLAVALDPAARVQGWVNGEPFYKGRSATAWRRQLRDTDDVATAAAAELRAGQGEAVAVCAWLLKTAPEADVRVRAAEALGRMGKAAAPAAPELLAALSDPDPLVRGVAARAVGELAPDVPGAVPVLAGLFPNVDAIRAVSRFGPAGAAVLPELAPLLAHPDATVRWQAARTIGKVGPGGKPAVGELVGLLGSDPDPLVREHAAEALGDIGPAAADGIPALVKALKDPEPKVRRDAVRGLGQMGAAAKGVLADVRAAANDPDAEVKAAAERAARLIDPAAGK